MPTKRNRKRVGSKSSDSGVQKGKYDVMQEKKNDIIHLFMKDFVQHGKDKMDELRRELQSLIPTAEKALDVELMKMPLTIRQMKFGDYLKFIGDESAVTEAALKLDCINDIPQSKLRKSSKKVVKVSTTGHPEQDKVPTTAAKDRTVQKVLKSKSLVSLTGKPTKKTHSLTSSVSATPIDKATKKGLTTDRITRTTARLHRTPATPLLRPSRSATTLSFGDHLLSDHIPCVKIPLADGQSVCSAGDDLKHLNVELLRNDTVLQIHALVGQLTNLCAKASNQNGNMPFGIRHGMERLNKASNTSLRSGGTEESSVDIFVHKDLVKLVSRNFLTMTQSPDNFDLDPLKRMVMEKVQEGKDKMDELRRELQSLIPTAEKALDVELMKMPWTIRQMKFGDYLKFIGDESAVTEAALKLDCLNDIPQSKLRKNSKKVVKVSTAGHPEQDKVPTTAAKDRTVQKVLKSKSLVSLTSKPTKKTHSLTRSVSATPIDKATKKVLATDRITRTTARLYRTPATPLLRPSRSATTLSFGDHLLSDHIPCVKIPLADGQSVCSAGDDLEHLNIELLRNDTVLQIHALVYEALGTVRPTQGGTGTVLNTPVGMAHRGDEGGPPSCLGGGLGVPTVATQTGHTGDWDGHLGTLDASRAASAFRHLLGEEGDTG
ncbi:borealin-2-like isoform X2 [Pelobates cultripes]|uniref:Borealin-2-like isoform X2 n=1 Tax=Pelobates cultripes TaxID=61616 RepID=A0AAD1THX5_PELCU|nr:borealin-2-like isoform X2 [Pelobates cultripes]